MFPNRAALRMKTKTYETLLGLRKHTSSVLRSGGRTRTSDLRVMSPTSYLCSTPRSSFCAANLHNLISFIQIFFLNLNELLQIFAILLEVHNFQFALILFFVNLNWIFFHLHK